MSGLDPKGWKKYRGFRAEQIRDAKVRLAFLLKQRDKIIVLRGNPGAE